MRFKTSGGREDQSLSKSFPASMASSFWRVSEQIKCFRNKIKSIKAELPTGQNLKEKTNNQEIQLFNRNLFEKKKLIWRSWFGENIIPEDKN